MKEVFKFLKLTLVLTFILTLNVHSQNIIYSKDYIQTPLRDCTPAFLEMLQDAKEYNSSKIIIAEGTYHFYPDKAYEKYCFIANHDDGLRRTPFPFIGMENIEIVAQNARFIFHGLMLPFIIEDSKNISLSGFSIDWEMPLTSEVLVVNSSPEKKSFDIKISSDQPYEIRNEELIFLKEGYEHNLDRSIYWDPKTGAVAYNAHNFAPQSTRSTPSITRFLDAINYPYDPVARLPVYYYRGKSISIKAKELEPGLVRISFLEGQAPPIGLTLVSKGLNGYNRWAPAIRIKNSSNIYMRNISIFSAGGMGLIAESSENISLDSFCVKPSPASGRMLSTSADATHFVNCRGKIEMNNSIFLNQLDDATNIHGIYLRVLDVLGHNKIGAGIGHYQQLGIDFAEKGDEIAFVSIDQSYLPETKNILRSMNKINSKYYVLTFRDSIQIDTSKMYALENLSAYPEVEISNCTVMNNYARGFLIKTPQKTIIENNYVSSMMEGIKVVSDYSFWHESGRASDLTIRNNRFGDCGYGNKFRKSPVINIHTNSKGPDYIFNNIVIEDNVFNTFDAAILFANKVNNLIITGNKVYKSDRYEPFHPEEYVFSIVDSKNTIMKDNNIKTDFKNKVYMDKQTKKSSIISNNEGF